MEQLPRRLVPVHVGDDVDHEVRASERSAHFVLVVAGRRPGGIVPPSRRGRTGRDRVRRIARPGGEAVLVAVLPPGEEQPADHPGDATEDARRDYRTQDALPSALLPPIAASPAAFRTAPPALPARAERRAAAGEPARFRKRRHPPRGVPRRLESPRLVYHGRVRRARRAIVVGVDAMPAEVCVSAALPPAVAVAIALVRVPPPPRPVVAVGLRRIRHSGP